MRAGVAVVVAITLSVTCSVYDASLLDSGRTPAPSGGSEARDAAPDSSQPGGAGGLAGSGSAGSAGGGAGGALTAGSSGSAAGGADAGEPYDLIDDMEDGDMYVLAGNGRNGYWEAVNDETAGATQDPSPGSFHMFTLAEAGIERTGSMSSAGMHVTNDVGSGWGALIVVSMKADFGAYDASAYCGMHFWARRGPSVENFVVRVVDKHSSHLSGLCIDSPDAGNQQCNDDFHTSVAVTTEWKEYTVRFDELMQWGFGYAADGGVMDSSALHAISFYVDEAEDYEIFVDDLAFVRAGFCD